MRKKINTLLLLISYFSWDKIRIIIHFLFRVELYLVLIFTKSFKQLMKIKEMGRKVEGFEAHSGNAKVTK